MRRIPEIEHTAHFWRKVDKTSSPSGCWLWTGNKHPRGYGTIMLARHTYRAHRYAYLITYGELPEGMEVCHRCDNPPCVNPNHLFLGTHQDNMDDMKAKGRLPYRKGAASGRAKLTEDQVRDIRSRYVHKYGCLAALSREFGVTPEAIAYVVSRKNWSHIP